MGIDANADIRVANMGDALGSGGDGNSRKAPPTDVNLSKLLGDFCGAGLLAAALIAVYLADGRLPGSSGQPVPQATEPPLSDTAAATLARPVMGPSAPPEQQPVQLQVPSQDVAVDSDDNGRESPATRGIISEFEAFVPRIIDEPPPPEPKIVDPPEPEPPKLVETAPEPPPPPLEPKKVEFFETETQAVAVGFVVDCSSSMQGPKFRAVCNELARSILNLDRKQKFFVVFFNDRFYPMSGSGTNPRLVPADLANKRAIIEFLRTAQADGGTDPEPALRFIAGLSPDVVYLLTDGEFSPLSEVTFDQLGKSHVAVHTIGFELGGRSPNLEEIAKRTSGTYREASKDAVTRSLFLADPGDIRAALRSPDTEIRREAVMVSLLRQLPLVDEVIAMLSDADSTISDAIHEELKAIASGSDFGPKDAADVPAAVHRWKLWWSLRSAPRAKIVSYLSGPEPDARWVAASHARTAGIDAYDELIEVMRLSASPVWEEAHAALVGISGGRDFGPATDASAADVEAAAARWAEWRAEEREKIARVLHEKNCKHAAELLRLAKYFLDSKPDVLERRCREIVKRYPDTPAADEARNLLDGLAVDEAP